MPFSASLPDLNQFANNSLWGEGMGLNLSKERESPAQLPMLLKLHLVLRRFCPPCRETLRSLCRPKLRLSVGRTSTPYAAQNAATRAVRTYTPYAVKSSAPQIAKS